MRAYMVDVIAVEDDEGTTTKYWTTDGAYLGADESAKKWEEFTNVQFSNLESEELGAEAQSPAGDPDAYEPDDGPSAIRKRIRWVQTQFHTAGATPELSYELNRLERALKELQS